MGGPLTIHHNLSDADARTVRLRLHNVLPIPTFELGIDDDASFRAELANTSVPWTYITAENVGFSQPASLVLDSPDDLAQMVDQFQRVWVEEAAWGAKSSAGRKWTYVDQVNANGGAHSGNPLFVSYAAMNNETAPFWRADIADHAANRAGFWGFFHELGHTAANYGPFDFEGSGVYWWRETAPNIAGMAAIQEVWGPDSWKVLPDMSDAERAIQREAHVCGCEAAGGCVPDDGSFDVNWMAMNFGLGMMDDPTIGFDTFAVLNAIWVVPPEKDWQLYVDQMASELSELTMWDLGPYFTRMGAPPSAHVLSEMDAYPDWPGDPTLGIVCP
jgi:hypothetical protein